MKKLVKIIISTAILMTINSCSNIGYRAVTLAPCIPKEKISLKERTRNYMNKADSLYLIEIKDNHCFREKQINLRYNLMKF